MNANATIICTIFFFLNLDDNDVVKNPIIDDNKIGTIGNNNSAIKDIK